MTTKRRGAGAGGGARGGPRRGVGLERLVRGEVAANARLRLVEGRLAEEEVGVAGKLDEPVARRGVGAVGERPVAVRYAQPVALERVVEHPVRDELEAGGGERLLLLVLVHVEELEDRVRVEDRIEPVQRLAPAVWQPELGRLLLAARAEEPAEGPRHEVAPVVEMEVRDDDRVEPRPRLQPPQAGQHAGAAVEPETPVVLLDGVARLGGARVGPRGGAADDLDSHGPYPRCNERVLARRSAAVYNCAVASASVDTLKKVPLFAGLDNRELEQIANSMRERRFKEGDTVTQEGAGGVGFFVVEEGQADVTVGGESKGSVGPGDYFGEIALINESPRTATLTARTPMLCYGMTPWDFRPLVESNSTIAWKLLSAMAEKMR